MVSKVIGKTIQCVWRQIYIKVSYNDSLSDKQCNITYYLRKMHFKYVKNRPTLTINTHLRQPLMTPYDEPCDMGPVQWCAGQDSVCGISISASVDFKYVIHTCIHDHRVRG